MSTVAITCPGCGSTSTKQIKPDTHQCESCQGTFNFVRANDKVVTQDVRTHNCPICGRAIKPGFGNLCKACDTGDLCLKCVQDLPKRGFVCKQCLMADEIDCDSCGMRSDYSCISCKTLKKDGKLKSFSRTCEEHVRDLFWYKIKKYDKGPGYVYRTFSCDTCDGLICEECVKSKEAFWGLKYYCKNCENELKMFEEFVSDYS